MVYLKAGSPTFLAPMTSVMEDNFSIEQGAWMVWG